MFEHVLIASNGTVEGQRPRTCVARIEAQVDGVVWARKLNHTGAPRHKNPTKVSPDDVLHSFGARMPTPREVIRARASLSKVAP